MPRIERKIIEMPSGLGELRLGGEVISNVRYRLKVEQDLWTPHSPFDDVQIPTGTTVSGHLTILETPPEFAENRLYWLGLNDGRHLEFTTASVDLRIGLILLEETEVDSSFVQEGEGS